MKSIELKSVCHKTFLLKLSPSRKRHNPKVLIVNFWNKIIKLFYVFNYNCETLVESNICG